MATVIRAKISEKNKYWIDKHRHYELKHFCLQYPSWKQAYAEINNMPSSTFNEIRSNSIPGDPTSKHVIMRSYYLERIRLIEQAAIEADRQLYKYILRAVTEGLSFTYLKTKMEIPCGKDLYYDRYRRFFWLLNNTRK